MADVNSATASGQSSSDQVLTVPNLLSAARLLAVPVFAWLLVTWRDEAALVLLAAATVTDLADGWLARRLGQVSALGTLLDPAADRALVVAAVLGLAWRGTLPLVLVALLLGRELVLGANLLLLRRAGVAPLPVHLLGKAATFILFWAFPLLLLAGAVPAADWVRPLGWAALLWGVGLYWWSAAGYLVQGRAVLSALRVAPGSPA